jgi:hypothetical protein
MPHQKRRRPYAQLDHYGKQLKQQYCKLNFVESLMVAYGLFPALRKMITATNNVVRATNIDAPKLPPPDEQAYDMAFAVLTASKGEREGEAGRS